MQTKLTLRLDDELIKYAKAFAGEQGKSVSELVEDYFFALKAQARRGREELPEIVKKFRGAAKGPADQDDYHRYLNEKYR